MKTSNLEEDYRKTIRLKTNLIKLEALISVEPDEDQKRKYRKLKDNLIQAINNATDQLKGMDDDYGSSDSM